jgi:hypothetical protein
LVVLLAIRRPNREGVGGKLADANGGRFPKSTHSECCHPAKLCYELRPQESRPGGASFRRHARVRCEQLGLPFDGDAGYGLPILSVGGSAGAEQAAISFTVE